MSPKLKPRLKTLIQSSPSEPPRNSFTRTDYYRKTRDEYYSPVSYMVSSSPGSLYADLKPEMSSPTSTRLAHIHEAGEREDREENETGAPHAAKRTANLWHVFETLFRKWFPQKEHRNHHEGPRL
ncbi:hypothetical protein C8R45DRAFT_1091804 [Mycena sanguinolenta]|nr:hypothetical protein C8R45DRAFT_1091804 [Mycena sanguinolenta]